MLFNSYEFLLVFLPIVLTGFYFTGYRGHHRIAVSWLVACSIIFYGWWNPAYVGLILISILFNYSIGVSLLGKAQKNILFIGIFLNLALLGYFKYANFFVDNINIVIPQNIHLEKIILPLAISFFTFQQITYLVDAYRGLTREYNFLQYCLFVTFFPQLIAGPIVHHKEMMPQFVRDTIYKFKFENMSVGLTIFCIGLFKKVVLADGVADHANSVFSAAEAGSELTFFEAWGGALAYTFQLYFDFSGYSDMALGLARMFGIVLPINFLSPYKATSIIDFWRRWHITLSRFLRDYVYIPLGGNRKGISRRHINLLVTMVLGGLWHGAGWTFIVWGGLHGIYLIVNHAWRFIINKIRGNNQPAKSKVFNSIGWLITFLCVVVSWVLFRSESMSSALEIYKGMLGFNGISIPSVLVSIEKILQSVIPGIPVTAGGLGSFGAADGYIKIILLFAITLMLPNTIQWMQRFQPALNIKEQRNSGIFRNLEWKARFTDSLVLAVLIYITVIYMSIGEEKEFLYFNF